MKTARTRPKSSRAPTWMRSKTSVYPAAALLIIGMAGLVFGLYRHKPLPILGGLFWLTLAGAWLSVAYLGIKRAAIYAGVAVLTLAALVSAAVAITLWIYGNDPRMPKADELKNYKPKQTTRIVARDGGKDVLLGELYTQRRSFVAYEDIPEDLITAFVVAEDAGFWEHSGIDYKGMIRAFFANLTSGQAKQGASTITQQVVKNLLLTPEKTFRRKMQEIILARRVEGALTKEEIMELYLNQIYFGQGRYGVLEAARYYFRVDTLDQLNWGQMAYLAGLPQAPEAISSNAKRGGMRLQYVLNQLLAHEKIDLATAEKFKDMPVPPYDDPPRQAVAPEVVDLVRAKLLERYGEKDLDTLGGEVVVTVRPEVQRIARDALQARLRKYDKKFKIGIPTKKVAEAKVDDEIARLAKKLKGGAKAGKTYPAVVTAVDDASNTITVDLGAGPKALALDGPDRARLDPDRKKASERFARGDVVDVVAGEELHFPRGPEGAVVVIDVKTRDVLALVGGFDVRPGDFNRATQAKRQAGSTFKPFVYALALKDGGYTAASIVNDAPDAYDLYKPRNYHAGFKGPVRLRYALAESINTVAIRLCHTLGPGAVAAMANAMGIESKLPEQISLALGSGEVTPLELTNAFATFAAGGRYQAPRVVQSIGDELERAGTATQALPPDVAYIVVDMMRSVMEKGGTGAGAADDLKVKVVGKTGTSDDERDAWFIGLTPDYAIGVWVGYDDNRPLGAKQTGGAVSLPVFVDVVNKIGSKGRRFEKPSGVVLARIDAATGLLAPEGAPADSYLDEVFLEGTAPTEYAVRAGEVDTTTFVTDEYGDDEPEETEPDAGAEPVAHP